MCTLLLGVDLPCSISWKELEGFDLPAKYQQEFSELLCNKSI